MFRRRFFKNIPGLLYKPVGTWELRPLFSLFASESFELKLEFFRAPIISQKVVSL